MSVQNAYETMNQSIAGTYSSASQPKQINKSLMLYFSLSTKLVKLL